MLNEPSFLLCAMTSRLVARARALMSVAGRTAPLLSVTVPFIEPSVCCANAECAETVRLNREMTTTVKHFREDTTALRSERRIGKPPLLEEPYNKDTG